MVTPSLAGTSRAHLDALTTAQALVGFLGSDGFGT